MYCGRIVNSEEHECVNKPKDTRRGRQLATDSTKWRKVKHDVKCRDLKCVLCWYGGLYNPIEEVHHIIPIDINDSENYVYSVGNCVGLCRECHHKVHKVGWNKYSKLLQRLIEKEK